MLRIKALNDDLASGSENEDEVPRVTKEAQEEITISRYQKALLYEVKGSIDEALQHYRIVLDDDLPKLEEKDGLPQKFKKLQYSCFKNIGGLFAKKENYRAALEFYIDAAEIDNTDVVLWHRIGHLAKKLKFYTFAANAFQKALECNPNHWPSLDQRVLLLFALREDLMCLSVIYHALELNPDYTRGLSYRKHLVKYDASLHDYYLKLTGTSENIQPLDTPFDETVGEELLKEANDIAEEINAKHFEDEARRLEPKCLTLAKPLEEYSWVDLARTILQTYKDIVESGGEFCKLELNRSLPVKPELTVDEPDLIIIDTEDSSHGDEDVEIVEEDDFVGFAQEIIDEILSGINYGSGLEQKNDPESMDVNVNEATSVQIESSEIPEPMDVDSTNIIKTPPPTANDPSRNDHFYTSPLLDADNGAKNIPNDGKLNVDDVDEVPKNVENVQEKNDCETIQTNLNSSFDDLFSEPSLIQTNEKLSLNVEVEEKSEVIEINEDGSDKILEGVAVETRSSDNIPLDLSHPNDQRVQKSNGEDCNNLNLPVKDQIASTTDTNSETDKEEKNTKSKKPTKRRNSLSMLQIWGWHDQKKYAKRKTTTKTYKDQKDMTLFDSLVKIMPGHLISPNFTLKSSNKSTTNNTNKTAPNEIAYFGSDDEVEDVKQFWDGFIANNDIVSMIESFLTELRRKFNVVWPKDLILLCVEMYEVYRKYFKHPCLYTSSDHAKVLSDAEITLVYGELVLGRWFAENNETNRSFHHGVLEASLQHLEMVILKEQDWIESSHQCDFITYFARTYWLRAIVCIYKSEYDNALDLLSALCNGLQSHESREIHIANFANHSTISYDLVRNEKQSLERYCKLTDVNELFEAKEYYKIIPVLQETFDNEPIVWPDSQPGNADRPLQISMLMDALWATNQMTDCLIWCEKSFNEAVQSIVNFSTGDSIYKRWSTVIKIALGFIKAIIKEESAFILKALSPDALKQLTENLIRFVCYQLDSKFDRESLPLGIFSPWIIIYFILQMQEDAGLVKNDADEKKSSSGSEDDDEDIPASLMVFFIAHDHLGRRNWCTYNEGELLLFAVDVVMPMLRTPLLEPVREKISPYMEQIFYCLYQHPSKKNNKLRYLVDHNVPPIKLSWDYAQKLFDFYRPDVFPQFDSLNRDAINTDTESLFKRIVHLIPTEQNPNVNMKYIEQFITGESDQLESVKSTLPHKVSGIYYLLGDYYQRNNDYANAIRYFTLDLCNNPVRLDSWVGIAMDHAAMLEIRLNSCEILEEADFLAKTKTIQHCYQKAFEQESKNLVLWIEYGSFAYWSHSFCSRVMKSEAESLSMERFELLEAQKDSLLVCAKNCFLQADRIYVTLSDDDKQDDKDERWLHQYVLGKVAEKQGTEPKIYLEHYLKAAELLHENNAVYPGKVNYNNPETLSVEALELHYRVHASILKFVESHEKKSVSCSTAKTLKKCLHHCRVSPFNTQISKDQEKASEEIVIVENDDGDKTLTETNVGDKDGKKRQSSSPLPQEIVKKGKLSDEKDEKEVEKDVKSSESSSDTSSDDDSTSSTSSVSSVSTKSSKRSKEDVKVTDDVLSKDDMQEIMQECVENLEKCVSRFPQHYKAIYRLAHFYFHRSDPANRDATLQKCRQLLLSSYRCKNGEFILGLFAEKRSNNFFNNIWRIPVSEVDRPGSFVAHMSRCISLLMQVLRASYDHRLLLEISLQLRRTPDPDKTYLRESERKQLSQQAYSLCVRCLRELLRALQSGKFVQISQNGTNKILDTTPEKSASTSTTTTTTSTETEVNLQFLLDVYRAYQKAQKYIAVKETTFSQLLIDSYKHYMGGKVVETANVLELANKFCQQRLAATRVTQPATSNAAKMAMSTTALNYMQQLAAVQSMQIAASILSATKIKQTNKPYKRRSTGSTGKLPSTNRPVNKYTNPASTLTAFNLNTPSSNIMMPTINIAAESALLSNYTDLLRTCNTNLTMPKAQYMPNKDKAPNKLSILKAVYGKEKSTKPKATKDFTNMLDKRPNISLTPLMTATKTAKNSVFNPFATQKSLTKNATKTLQEKLAERKNIFSPPKNKIDFINLADEDPVPPPAHSPSKTQSVVKYPMPAHLANVSTALGQPTTSKPVTSLDANRPRVKQKVTRMRKIKKVIPKPFIDPEVIVLDDDDDDE